MKVLKYTGKYRDLIPMGLQFQKLFANNYRCYNNYHETGEARLSIWVWQKGNYIEFDNWNAFSAPIIEYLQSNPFTPYTDIIGGEEFHVDYIELICDRKTLTVKKKESKDDLFELFLKKKQGKITTEEYQKKAKAYHKRYREITVTPSELFKYLDMLKGKYEIVEETNDNE